MTTTNANSNAVPSSAGSAVAASHSTTNATAAPAAVTPAASPAAPASATAPTQASPDSQTSPASPAPLASLAPTSAAPSGAPLDTHATRDLVVEAIKTCYDPEIPVDIWELGLIYRVDVKPNGAVECDMTLTSPACPVAGTLPPEVKEKIATVAGVTDVKVAVVWDPPWTPALMSEAAKLQLGFFG